jgi:hypothetical protein
VRVDIARLDLAEPFGRGGQGTIYEIDPAVAHAVGWSGPVVAKLYKQRLPSSALQAFLERVRWACSLAHDARAELHGAAAWPLMVIEERGLLAGIVMPDERERFDAQMRLPSGSAESVLMNLDHVMSDDAYLERRFGVACDTRVRATLAERLAAALAVLHMHSIVASDISQANVLVRLAEPCAVTLIDCDSMTFRGESTLKLVETPDWEIPPEWGELARTRGADAYKLGLAIMRLFARDRFQRDPGPAEPYVPTALHPLLRDALGHRSDLRPSAGRWQAALRDVLGTPLTENFPGPPPRGGARRGAAVWTPGQPPVQWPGAPQSPAPAVAQGSPLAGATAGVGPSPAPPGGPFPRTTAQAPAATPPPRSPAPGGTGRRPPLARRARTEAQWRRPAALIVVILMLIAAAIAVGSASSGSNSTPQSLDSTPTVGSTPRPAGSTSRPAGQTSRGTSHRSATAARPHVARAGEPHPSSAHSAGEASRAAGSGGGEAHPRGGSTSSSSSSPPGPSSTTHADRGPARSGGTGEGGLQGGAEQPPSSSGGASHGESGGLEGAAQGGSGSGGGGGGGLSGGGSH